MIELCPSKSLTVSLIFDACVPKWRIEEIVGDVVRAGNEFIFNVVCFESSREFSLEGCSV